MAESCNLSDEELACAGAGDSEKVTELISRYKGAVFSAARVFASQADREDLVSDGFEALLTAVREYSPERGSFGAFASVCIRNAMKNTVKRSKKRSGALAEGSQELEQVVDPSPSPEERFIGKEANAEFFRRAVEELSDLEMRCIDGIIFGLSYDEIAQRLGVDRKSVDNAAARARAKLRSVYGRF